MKKLLLTATALAAMAIAGTAAAQSGGHVISYRATATVGDIDAGSANTVANADPTTTDAAKYGRSLVGLYLIAEEATGLTGNTLALQDNLSSGAIPSGNNLYTVSLTNATFSTAVASTAVQGVNCTVAPSSGGAAGSNSVTFLVSSSGGGNCTGFTLDLPVTPTLNGVVTVSTNIRTDNEVPIDGGLRSFDAIFPIDAFQPAFNATFSGVANGPPGAGVDTFTPIGVAPATPYTSLSGDGTLGRLAIYVDTRANRGLTPATPVAVADVTAASVAVTGDFDAFNAANTNATLEGNNAASITPTVATFTAAQGYITELLTSKPNGSPFFVTADGGVIDASAYNATINYTLAAGFAAQPAANGAFESIEREGANFIAPWAGGSQGGSQTVVRLSGTGSATGPVRVTLTNGVATGGTAVADSTCTLGGVPANGDLVIGQPQLTACFGGFLRGDLLITVEGAPASLTAKMRNTTAGGDIFETSLGRYSGSNFSQAAQ